MPPPSSSSSSERVTVGHEDPQKLVASSRKKFWTNLITIGVILSIIIVSLLCSFLIPGLPQYTKVSLWQFAAMVFIVTVIFIGMNLLEEFGMSSPQTDEEPKPLTGADLC